MRISMRGLDAPFVYPCSKADVREAFGEDVLTTVFFGLRADYDDSRGMPLRRSSGRVLLTLSVSTRRKDDFGDWIGLHLYRVRREDWSDYLHWQFRQMMKETLLPWAKSVIDRPQAARDGYRWARIELDEGQLKVYAPPE